MGRENICFKYIGDTVSHGVSFAVMSESDRLLSTVLLLVVTALALTAHLGRPDALKLVGVTCMGRPSAKDVENATILGSIDSTFPEQISLYHGTF